MTHPTTASHNDQDDAFEDIFAPALSLESTVYQRGYEEGYTDGLESGKIEGRALGLEKGFGKFLEAGKIYGKGIVWKARLNECGKGQRGKSGRMAAREGDTGGDEDESGKADSTAVVEERHQNCPRKDSDHHLPPLKPNPRIEKNIGTILELMDPETLSTMNDDEAVKDFEERYKGAAAKAKVIESLIGRKRARKRVLSIEEG